MDATLSAALQHIFTEQRELFRLSLWDNSSNWQSFMAVLLAFLAIVICAVWQSANKDTRRARFPIAFFALVAFLGGSVYTWDYSNKISLSQQEKYTEKSAEIQADECRTVLQAISTGEIRNLQRNDVDRIRFVCSEVAFLAAANAPASVIDFQIAALDD